MNHPQPHDITALAYGLVPSPERESLLEHVHFCAPCREAYDLALAEQAEVREVLLGETRSGDAESRALDAVLQQLKKAGQVQRPGRLISLRPAAWALQAAAALLLAAGVYYVAVALPGGETPPTTVAGGESAGGGSVKSPDAASLPGLEAGGRVTDGSVMVAMDPEANPETARWTRSKVIPANVWVHSSDSEPVACELDNARLSFVPDSMFKLVPDSGTPGQYAIFVLRGDANFAVKDSRRSLTVQTGTGDILATPGSTFDLECDPAFVFANYRQRGKDLPSPQKGRALVRTHVQRGDVLFMPYGESWERPEASRVASGQTLEVQTVVLDRMQRLRAQGGSSELEEVMNLVERLLPGERRKFEDELERMRKQLDTAQKIIELTENVVLKISVNGREYEHSNGVMQIIEGATRVTLRVTTAEVLGEAELDGKKVELRAANFEELARQHPQLKEMLETLSLKEVPGGRRISLRRIAVQQESRQETSPQQQR